VKTVEEIKAAIEAVVPGAGVKIISNSSPSGQHSLLLDSRAAIEVARFLRDDPDLSLDFLSNVTGVDYLDKEVSEKVKVTRPVTKTVDGVEQTVEETVEETRKHTEPGYLEAVYHLYSMAKKHGPVVLRNMLASHPEVFVGVMTEKLLTYALGRGVEYYDMPAVRKIVRDSARDGRRFSSIVMGIVKSPPFQMQRVETASSN